MSFLFFFHNWIVYRNISASNRVYVRTHVDEKNLFFAALYGHTWLILKERTRCLAFQSRKKGLDVPPRGLSVIELLLQSVSTSYCIFFSIIFFNLFPRELNKTLHPCLLTINHWKPRWKRLAWTHRSNSVMAIFPAGTNWNKYGPVDTRRNQLANWTQTCSLAFLPCKRTWTMGGMTGWRS